MSLSIPDQRLEKNYNSILVRPVLSQIDKTHRDDKVHRHLFQEIIYIKEGEGSHYIDDKLITLEAHSFYLIGMNQVHGFNYGKNLKGTLIRFNEDFLPIGNEYSNILRDYSNTIFLSNELAVSGTEAEQYETLLDMMLAEYQSGSARKFVSVQHLLLVLLNKITANLLEKLDREDKDPEDRERLLYNKFHLLSNQYFDRHHQLDYYIKTLGVSGRKLSSVCMKFSGKTAKSILIEKLISEIKRNLKYSGLSIKEIAYKLGFEDPAYMSRLFKNYTSVTMSNYRKPKA